MGAPPLPSPPEPYMGANGESCEKCGQTINPDRPCPFCRDLAHIANRIRGQIATIIALAIVAAGGIGVFLAFALYGWLTK